MDISRADVDITCDRCRHKFKKQLGWLKANPSFKGPKCQDPVNIGPAAVDVLEKKVLKSIADLKRDIDRLGKG